MVYSPKRRQLLAALPAVLCSTSCSISVQYTSAEERRVLEAMMDGKEVGWDPTPVLEGLKAAQDQAEKTLLYRHWLALGEAVPVDQRNKQLLASLQDIVGFIRKVGKTPALIEALSVTVDDQGVARPLNASRSQIATQLDSTGIMLDESPDSTAYAFVDSTGRLPPRAAISIGLIRRLVQSREEAIAPLAELVTLHKEIKSLPKKGAYYVTDQAFAIIGRAMDAQMAVLGLGQANIEYAAALLFVCAHELAHIAFDRYDPPGTERFWPELRADLFGVIATELLTRQKASQEAANESLFRGGFQTDNPDTLIRIASDAGFVAFFEVYQQANFKERGGDQTHLPVDQRLKLLKPAHERLFKKK